MVRQITLLLRLQLLLLACVAFAAQAETVFTHRAPETDGDTRPNFEVSMLRLALEKTLDEYGPYRLEPAPRINVTRSIHSIRANTFPNYFYTLGYEESYNQYPEMTYVPFPVDLGLLGYRTCFVSKKIKQDVAKITKLEDLRKLSIGQGRGWVDVEILRHNGFQVVELEPYDTLFRMVAANRFDLFCRGANEVKDEYEHWHNLKDFDYDRSFLLHYPMPIFYYTNRANTQAIERVNKGLRKAYADGSLHALWTEQHQSSISFARLDKRRIFELENPLIQNVNKDYTNFVFPLGGEYNLKNSAKSKH